MEGKRMEKHIAGQKTKKRAEIAILISEKNRFLSPKLLLVQKKDI